MKKINIFEKKIPILVILVVLLIIGTASAAVFTHYATLSGEVTVEQTIFVNNLPIGGDGTDLLNFNDGDTATFSITNVGDVDTDVELVTTIIETDGFGNEFGEELTLLNGVSVIYSIDGENIPADNIITIPHQTIVPPLTITAMFVADQDVIGTFNVYTDVIIPGSVS